jgi:dCMP deaminase
MKMTTSQEKKHHYYLDVALAISKHAKCLRGNFGAVIVKDHMLISTGYNGPARKVPHCKKCLREEKYGTDVLSGFGYGDCIAVHAEVNAIVNAARHGINVSGSTLYLDSHNRTPDTKYNRGDVMLACESCTRTMVNAGIEWFVIRTNKKVVVYHLPTMVKTGAIR